MKTWEKIMFVFTTLALIGAVAIIVIEWKKDSDVWRSLKKAALERDLLKL